MSYSIYGKIVVMNDFDGTILDTMEAHGILAADCINRHFGMDLKTAKRRYFETAGVPFHRQLETIFPGDDFEAQRQKCAAEYHNRKIEEVYFQANLFPDVFPYLGMLDDKGAYATISTSTEGPLTSELLIRHDIADAFIAIRGAERGSKPKHIKEVKIYGPRLILFAGDSRSDMALSKSEGVTAIGRSGPETKGMLSRGELIEAGAYDAFDELTCMEYILNLP